MKTLSLTLAFIAVNTLCLPVAAQETEEADVDTAEVAPDPQSKQATAGEPDDDDVECRNLAPRVGTRIPGRRVCLTVYQWRQWEENTREEMRDTERRGLIRNVAG